VERRADDDLILVIPCSGIGKVHGLIGREAAYVVTDELAPEQTDTLCLALLVKGDSEASAKVRAHRCITVDGCPKVCAKTSVEAAGGRPVEAIQVVEFFKDHRGAQPGTAAALKEDGWTIAREVAHVIAGQVAQMHGDVEVDS
jgi:uncharacterized metal-binding protein